MIKKRTAVLLSLSLLLATCSDSQQELSLQLQNSFRAFIEGVETQDAQTLERVVFFPGVRDYAEHTRQLLLNYLGAVQTGPITFDEQGVVLVRFLKLRHLRWQVLKAEPVSETDARLRLSVHFAYDANMVQADFEQGTKVFIPAKPWGTAHTIVIGGENPIPREQLRYLEIEILLRRTNLPGWWQVRTCTADEATIEYEISTRTDY